VTRHTTGEAVVAEALDALSHDEHEINTASNERLELLKLHASDPLAVDRALALSLTAPNEAARRHRSF
jgi:hypothetical protein